MSNDIAISIRNLSKAYFIAHGALKRPTFRDVAMERVRHPFRRPQRETFWALKDVSFDVKKGEVVGIIGRNGAGKSTLLKILSRITEPTAGRVELYGRIGCLLEVGTGFHPELTGRENIYLNGAILGMKKAEIRRQFEAIVDFAEIEKFIDTPVKRYSSGMYLRLAFAVAAHLNPEILIVDEVLAVGDAEFQKKCLGKMGEVAKEGRTVLFVTHNMNAIKRLCVSALVLANGTELYRGGVQEAVQAYMRNAMRGQCSYTNTAQFSKPHIKRVQVRQGDNRGPSFRIDQPILIEVEVEAFADKEAAVGLKMVNEEGLCVHHTSDEFSWRDGQASAQIRVCEIPAYGLASGRYAVVVSLGHRNYELYESISDALDFDVCFIGSMADRTVAREWKGVCGPGLLKWVFCEA